MADSFLHQHFLWDKYIHIQAQMLMLRLEQTRRTLAFQSVRVHISLFPLRKTEEEQIRRCLPPVFTETESFWFIVSSLSSQFQYDDSHPVSSTIIVPFFNMRAMAAACHGVFILDSEVMGLLISMTENTWIIWICESAFRYQLTI